MNSPMQQMQMQQIQKMLEQVTGMMQQVGSASTTVPQFTLPVQQPMQALFLGT